MSRHFLASLFLVWASSASALTYDLEQDFSLEVNPDTPWSYGYYQTGYDANTFIQFQNSAEDYKGYIGLDARFTDSYPSIYTNTSVNSLFGTGWYPADAVSLHPGLLGEVAVVRWTAPTPINTLYLDAAFMGLDSTTTDVHIAFNGLDIFTDQISPRFETRWGDEAGITTTLMNILPGDYIDFSVGFGSGNANNDMTSVRAVLSDVAGQNVREIEIAPYHPFVRVPAPGKAWPEGAAPVPLPPSISMLLGSLFLTLIGLRYQARKQPIVLS